MKPTLYWTCPLTWTWQDVYSFHMFRTIILSLLVLFHLPHCFTTLLTLFLARTVLINLDTTGTLFVFCLNQNQQLDLQSIGSSPDLHQRVPSSIERNSRRGVILGAILVLLLREQITTFWRVYHLCTYKRCGKNATLRFFCTFLQHSTRKVVKILHLF